ncbi:hypothetical protein AMAG_03247 [Allomyces macrogynus ATCC 38327]|uniref:FYVE-type domain-containing protein n=1 Tax=Allomyces macrogynus (strain ATCC 38327) TaxID=578462 RepID=A0A0L0S560_ALLM3|nr:hypothetical protein AMAG_03247 [Allomyces macrogynus ATCC 38327]|eukprot:KNE57546.1 hypothetical protein AMAG_03247 [Allomyces macrogynus ATCC 38327]
MSQPVDFDPLGALGNGGSSTDAPPVTVVPAAPAPNIITTLPAWTEPVVRGKPHPIYDNLLASSPPANATATTTSALELGTGHALPSPPATDLLAATTATAALTAASRNPFGSGATWPSAPTAWGRASSAGNPLVNPLMGIGGGSGNAAAAAVAAFASPSATAAPAPVVANTPSPVLQRTASQERAAAAQALVDKVFDHVVANKSLDLRNLLELNPDVSVNVVHPVSHMTPLLLAAARGFDAVVRVLLENGAIVDMVDPENETALHKACFSGNVYVVDRLVQARANPNKADKHGWTPLHIAVAKGNKDVVALLLQRPGIKVNCANQAGTTPLMTACAKGHLDLVHTLLDARSDPHLLNTTNETAYDLAALAMHVSVCHLLGHRFPDLVRHTRLRCVLEVQDRPPSGLIASLRRARASSLPPPTYVENDDPAKKANALELVALPDGWAWMTEWQLVDNWHVLDPEMEIARDAAAAVVDANPALATAAAAGGSLSRPLVRTWARVMRRQNSETGVPNATASAAAAAPRRTESSVGGDGDEGGYVARARAVVSRLPTMDDLLAQHAPGEPVRDAFECYQEASQILLAGIQEDTDPQRQKDAKFLLIQYLELAERLPESQRLVPSASAASSHASLPRAFPSTDPTSDTDTPRLPPPQPWQADAAASACHQCRSTFTVLRRRHHCRLCGKLYCGACSTERIDLARFYPADDVPRTLGHGPQRVCDTCYALLTAAERTIAVSVRSVSSGGDSSYRALSETSPSPPPPVAVNPAIRHLSRTASVASSLGSLVECPACMRPLAGMPTQSARERHLSECLAQPSAAAATAAAARYTIDIWGGGTGSGSRGGTPPSATVRAACAVPLPESDVESESDDEEEEEDTGMVDPTSAAPSTVASGLVDPHTECLICYEPFLAGDQVARMSCLCVFHWDCLRAWFDKHGVPECPVHLLPTNAARQQGPLAE